MTEIELQIKNPAQNLDGDFKLRVPQSATVGDVKAQLESEYPSRPERGSITVLPCFFMGCLVNLLSKGAPRAE
jgi:hypothetical protein